MAEKPRRTITRKASSPSYIYEKELIGEFVIVYKIIPHTHSCEDFRCGKYVENLNAQEMYEKFKSTSFVVYPNNILITNGYLANLWKIVKNTHYTYLSHNDDFNKEYDKIFAKKDSKLMIDVSTDYAVRCELLCEKEEIENVKKLLRNIPHTSPPHKIKITENAVEIDQYRYDINDVCDVLCDAFSIYPHHNNGLLFDEQTFSFGKYIIGVEYIIELLNQTAVKFTIIENEIPINPSPTAVIPVEMRNTDSEETITVYFHEPPKPAEISLENPIKSETPAILWRQKFDSFTLITKIDGSYVVCFDDITDTDMAIVGILRSISNPEHIEVLIGKEKKIIKYVDILYGFYMKPKIYMINWGTPLILVVLESTEPVLGYVHGKINPVNIPAAKLRN